MHIRTGRHDFTAEEAVNHGGDTAANPSQLAPGSLRSLHDHHAAHVRRTPWLGHRTHPGALQLVVQDDQRRMEREIHIEGALDHARRTRQLDITAKTSITHPFDEGAPISTKLAMSQARNTAALLLVEHSTEASTLRRSRETK